MATDAGTVEFLLGQMAGAGPVTARKMFGEYGLYLDGKMVAMVYDDQLYLKDLPPIRALIAAPETAPPYPGAKPHLAVTDEIDDPEALAALIRAAWDALPMPKPKKGKSA